MVRRGRAARAEEREQGADRRPARQSAGDGAAGKVGHEHDQHADEADDHRRPAIGAHLLVQDQRRQHHHDQRRGVTDRHRIRQRQIGQGEEAREHPAARYNSAQEMAAEIRGPDRVDEVAPPAEPKQQRHDGEGRPEEHDLAGGIIGADVLDPRRHDREGQGGQDFQRDAEERLHRMNRGREGDAPNHAAPRSAGARGRLRPAHAARAPLHCPRGPRQS